MTTTQTQVSPVTRRFILIVDRLIVFIGKHWLLLAILFLLLFAGLPMLAPALMYLGISAPAQAIYRVYGLTCHQLSYRTYFFFGAQPVYTIDQLRALVPGAAGEDATSLFWRDFFGNAQLGYKMAWCERDAAIYTTMLLSSMLFGLVRTRLKALDWRVFLLFVAPMAFDGLWQLFTSPLVILPFLPVHESTFMLRNITGALFGLGSVWLVYPVLQEAMRDVLNQAQAQYARGKAHEILLQRAAPDRGK
ncbi:MAG: DUF2085 domain-containing protein [Chloroflexota bacterium]|nr:DUF2085 domain-containing protein [Chloroflexota bacterium]